MKNVNTLTVLGYMVLLVVFSCSSELRAEGGGLNAEVIKEIRSKVSTNLDAMAAWFEKPEPERVGIVADVSVELNKQLIHKRGLPWRGVYHHMYRARFKELVQRDNLDLIYRFMSDARVFREQEKRYEQFREWAMRLLGSEKLDYRLRGLSHLSGRENHGKARKKIRQVTIQTLQETKGKWPHVRVAKELLTKADVGAIRSLYERSLGGDAPADPLSLGSAKRGSGTPNDEGNTSTALQLLLATLGDPQVKAKVRKALTQNQKPKQRVWGLLITVMADLEEFEPQVIDLLNDKSPMPERHTRIQDPEAEGPRLRADIYLRVCDQAAMWLHYWHDRPEDAFKFKIPWPGFSASPHTFSEDRFDYQRRITEAEFDDDFGVYRRSWIMGFTDTQLRQIEHYYAK